MPAICVGGSSEHANTTGVDNDRSDYSNDSCCTDLSRRYRLGRVRDLRRDYRDYARCCRLESLWVAAHTVDRFHGKFCRHRAHLPGGRGGRSATATPGVETSHIDWRPVFSAAIRRGWSVRPLCGGVEHTAIRDCTRGAFNDLTCGGICGACRNRTCREQAGQDSYGRDLCHGPGYCHRTFCALSSAERLSRIICRGFSICHPGHDRLSASVLPTVRSACHRT